jgi:hypothetical protein
MDKPNEQTFMRIDREVHDKLIKIRDRKKLKNLNDTITELLKTSTMAEASA